jgi:flagellar motility protein MotE (MotC chaperone)
MGKLIAILGIAIVGFLGAVVGMLAATGNLNKDTLDKMLGTESDSTAEAVPLDDPSSALVKALKSERERLAQQKIELDKRDEMLSLREREVDSTLTAIQELQVQINAAMTTLDEAQEANLQELAKTLENMKSQEAAIALAAMEPKDAVKLLPLIKDRDRGKIMDAMNGEGDKETRAAIFELMKDKLY